MNHNQQKWKNIIEEAKASGISGLAFCNQRGIKYATYQYWIRKLGLAAGRRPTIKVVGPRASTEGANYVKIQTGDATVSVPIAAGASWVAEFVRSVRKS